MTNTMPAYMLPNLRSPSMSKAANKGKKLNQQLTKLFENRTKKREQVEEQLEQARESDAHSFLESTKELQQSVLESSQEFLQLVKARSTWLEDSQTQLAGCIKQAKAELAKQQETTRELLAERGQTVEVMPEYPHHKRGASEAYEKYLVGTMPHVMEAAKVLRELQADDNRLAGAAVSQSKLQQVANQELEEISNKLSHNQLAIA